ncbi:protein kinase domain-containing protein [Ditylenchus destructor]|nr:protein kinase domain-containing protein [Ditylenchus destructor]
MDSNHKQEKYSGAQDILRVEEGPARTSVLAKLGLQRPAKIYDNVIKPLGKGRFGTVYLVEFPSKRVAVKSIDKAQLAKEEMALALLKNEIEAGMACDNPFVVKMSDFYENTDCVCLVFEPLENGPLIKFLELKFGQPLREIPEDFARFYVAQALLALNHLHSKGYTHNDVWIENFLLDKQGFLKLIDFGLAFNLPFRGWYYNRAPERIKAEEYGPSSDYWALGLLTYRLVFGKEAFTALSHSENETEEEKLVRWREEKLTILQGNYTIPESRYPVSENLKDFINSLLTVDPKQRLGHTNPEDIKNHKWFTSFNWEALEQRNAKYFHEYLHESKEADNDQVIPQTLEEEQITLPEANVAQVPQIDTAGGPNSMFDEDEKLAFYNDRTDWYEPTWR